MLKDPQVWQAIIAAIAAYATLLASMYVVITKPLLMSLSTMQSQITDIVQRLGRIEAKLDNHADRITRLEERVSPFRR